MRRDRFKIVDRRLALSRGKHFIRTGKGTTRFSKIKKPEFLTYIKCSRTYKKLSEKNAKFKTEFSFPLIQN